MEICRLTADGSCYIKPIKEFSSELLSVSNVLRESSRKSHIVTNIFAVVRGEQIKETAAELDQTACSRACEECLLNKISRGNSLKS